MKHDELCKLERLVNEDNAKRIKRMNDIEDAVLDAWKLVPEIVYELRLLRQAVEGLKR